MWPLVNWCVEIYPSLEVLVKVCWGIPARFNLGRERLSRATPRECQHGHAPRKLERNRHAMSQRNLCNIM